MARRSPHARRSSEAPPPRQGPVSPAPGLLAQDGAGGLRALRASLQEDSPSEVSDGERLRLILLERGQNVARLLRQERREASEEGIHDLRVATRRLDSVLTVVAHLTRRGAVKKLRRRTRALRKQTGGLRDLHIELGFVTRLSERFPSLEELQRVLIALEARRIGEVARALRDLPVKKFESRVRRLAKRLERSVRSLEAESVVGALLHESVDQAFLRVKKRVARAEPADSDSLHAVRIAFKNFRYQAEILAGVTGGEGLPDLEELQRVQRLMGSYQDYMVVIGWLEELWAKERSGSLLDVLECLEQERSGVLGCLMQELESLGRLWGAGA